MRLSLGFDQGTAALSNSVEAGEYLTFCRFCDAEFIVARQRMDFRCRVFGDVSNGGYHSSEFYWALANSSQTKRSSLLTLASPDFPSLGYSGSQRRKLPSFM